ncbi:alpha-galactosidase [Pseudolysinimonas sp.]|uniref:alpha-galactosidase n=1 Tax=Pseudolysinimonas sp. TaxID=2680009 RepID=UPI003F81DBFF
MSRTMGERMRWSLRTRTTEYAISDAPGVGVVLDHWGEPGPTEPWAEPDRIAGYTTAADTAPLEYASAGQRHIEFSELRIDRGDGRLGARWTLDAAAARSADEGDRRTLTLPFDDETGELRLELDYVASSRHDVIRRRMRIANRGAASVTLARAFSAGWNLPLGRRVHVDYLAGSWGREFQPRSVDLDWGTFSIGSRQGVTSMSFSPVVTVTALADPDSAARPGDAAYGVALAWSGSWRMQVEARAIGQHARVSCGVDEDTATVLLEPGSVFETPDSLGVFSADGPDGVTRAWHDFQRAELARDLDPARRPIVYNSWMATTFDVRIDHQRALASIAAELGVEVFVLDDGWFRGRVDDRAGLGDWEEDPAKFPRGVRELAEHVEGLGMRFGLWVEPECVNPDSDLYRAHPDWIYRDPAREPITIRHQFVLDLGREEVVAFIEDMLRRVLRSAPIGYLKWDMNRPVTDGGRPGDPHGAEWPVQHARGYYRILRMLRAEFPDVVLEACASGGARIDDVVLALSDVVWTSDQVGAPDRLVIQDGFLRAYPSWVMSSWVSDDLGHRDRRVTSLGYRFAVAMCGVLGIGSDLLAWSGAERAEAAERVRVYRDLRRVVLHGDVRRHGDPAGDLYTVEYAGPEDDPRTVLFVFDRDRDRTRDREWPRVFPTGLRDGVEYVVAGTGQRVTAATARRDGVVVPFAWAPDADVLVLEPTDAQEARP